MDETSSTFCHRCVRKIGYGWAIVSRSSPMRKDQAMDDDARAVLEEISELLPPRTTVYRSGAAAPVGDRPVAEPATEPIRLPASPL